MLGFAAGGRRILFLLAKGLDLETGK